MRCKSVMKTKGAHLQRARYFYCVPADLKNIRLSSTMLITMGKKFYYLLFQNAYKNHSPLYVADSRPIVTADFIMVMVDSLFLFAPIPIFSFSLPSGKKYLLLFEYWMKSIERTMVTSFTNAIQIIAVIYC